MGSGSSIPAPDPTPSPPATSSPHHSWPSSSALALPTDHTSACPELWGYGSRPVLSHLVLSPTVKATARQGLAAGMGPNPRKAPHLSGGASEGCLTSPVLCTSNRSTEISASRVGTEGWAGAVRSVLCCVSLERRRRNKVLLKASLS